MLGTLPLDRIEGAARHRAVLQRLAPSSAGGSILELRGAAEQVRSARAPAVLDLSGWNDDNYGPEGAITNYLGLVASRGGKSSRTALLLGPGSTASTRPPDEVRATRISAAAAAIDYDEVVAWLDGSLRAGRSHAVATIEAVRLFRHGDEPVGNVGHLASSRPSSSLLLVPARHAAAAGTLARTAATASSAEQLCFRSRQAGDQPVRVSRRSRLPVACRT